MKNIESHVTNKFAPMLLSYNDCQRCVFFAYFTFLVYFLTQVFCCRFCCVTSTGDKYRCVIGWTTTLWNHL